MISAKNPHESSLLLINQLNRDIGELNCELSRYKILANTLQQVVNHYERINSIFFGGNGFDGQYENVNNMKVLMMVGVEEKMKQEITNKQEDKQQQKQEVSNQKNKKESTDNILLSNLRVKIKELSLKCDMLRDVKQVKVDCSGFKMIYQVEPTSSLLPVRDTQTTELVVSSQTHSCSHDSNSKAGYNGIMENQIKTEISGKKQERKEEFDLKKDKRNDSRIYNLRQVKREIKSGKEEAKKKKTKEMIKLKKNMEGNLERDEVEEKKESRKKEFNGKSNMKIRVSSVGEQRGHGDKKLRKQRPSCDTRKGRLSCSYQGCTFVTVIKNLYHIHLRKHKKKKMDINSAGNVAMRSMSSCHLSHSLRPYRCSWPKCDMRFAKIWNAILHKRVHVTHNHHRQPNKSNKDHHSGSHSKLITTSARPFACQWHSCEYKTVSFNNLIEHEKRAHSNMPQTAVH